MQLLGWIIVVALVLLALFATANWTLLTAQASLNFLVFSVEGPLGVILLGATLLLVGLLAVYAMSVRMTSLVEARRHVKELSAQRELADQAEASRFTALGARIEGEFARLRAAQEESYAELGRRLDVLEQSLLKVLEDNASSLAAHVGQVDDKLNRIVPGAG